MTRSNKIVTACVGALVSIHAHSSQAASALQTLATSLQPGQWAEFTTNNIGPTLGPTFGGSTQNVLAESPEMVWDPLTQKVLFFGGDHCDIAQFITYDAATNTWQREPRAAWMPTQANYCNGMMHGEDLAGMDPARGNFYFREFFLYSREVHRYNTTTKTWTDLPLMGNVGDYLESSMGVDFFPEMNSLVIVNGGGGLPKWNNVYLFSETTQQWTTLPLGLSGPAESYRNFARYNPVHKVVLFSIAGFGDRRLFKLDRNGVVTRLKDAPIGLGIMCPCDAPAAIILADPVTGDYIVIEKDTKALWRYDVGTDTWTKTSTQVPARVFTSAPDNPIFSVAAATIASYQVHWFTSCDAANCRVHLYKYAAGPAVPVPNAPAAVTAN
jgi:hypothetical protein